MIHALRKVNIVQITVVSMLKLIDENELHESNAMQNFANIERSFPFLMQLI